MCPEIVEIVDEEDIKPLVFPDGSIELDHSDTRLQSVLRLSVSQFIINLGFSTRRSCVIVIPVPPSHL